MSQEQQTSFAGFWLYKRRESWYGIAEIDWEQAKQETAAVLAEPGEGITVRGTYSLVGLNANADLMVWTVALELEALQDYAVRLARTPLDESERPGDRPAGRRAHHLRAGRPDRDQRGA